MCSAYSLDAMWTIKSTTRLLYPYSLSYLGTENKCCQGLHPFFHSSLLLCPIPKQLNSHPPSGGGRRQLQSFQVRNNLTPQWDWSHSTPQGCYPPGSPAVTNTTQICHLCQPPCPPGLHLPGNQLDKMVVQCNASTRIKGGGMAVTIEVTGDNLKQKKL